MKFTPRAAQGKLKYGDKGNCTAELFSSLNIPEETKKNLAKWGNFGLAQGTWSSYRTAERMWWTCMKAKRRLSQLPASQDDITIFVEWLIEDRNVKAGTVKSYLAGIRQMHIVKGMDPPVIRSAGIQWVLKGKKNAENISARRTGQDGRLPMTVNMMKLLKETIRVSDEDITWKLLLWAVCCLAFNGAFRIHELLAKSATEFDVDFTLLTEHIRLREGRATEGGRFLEVKLQCPKEDKTGKAVIVEVFESTGSLGPVKAFERWRSRTVAELGYPLFREQCGTPLTGRKLNSWLKRLLSPYVDYSKKKITSHSFRIGLATTLGTLGFSDSDIKQAGRWNSNAYELYMRQPRVKRSGVAKKIGHI